LKLRVLEYDTVSSTNDVAVSLAKRGAREGLVVRSDYQTCGRGRGAHRWYAPRGTSLLMTILLRPKAAPAKLSNLTLLAAKAVADSLRRYMDSVSLKLPNDILVSGKKVGGVLVEGGALGHKQTWACIGIGVNVQTRPKKVYKRGTSVLIEAGKKVSISEALYDILSKFVENYGNKHNKIVV